MRKPSHRIFAIALLTGVVALAACNKPPVAPANTTPEGAVRADLVLTRNGDFDGLLRSTLPPPDYQAWRTAWQRVRAQQPSPTAPQRQQFAQMMRKLTAPDAENALFKQLQPQLAQMSAHRQHSAPMLIGILEAAGDHLLENAAGLSPAQKQQARQALTALAGWAGSADFSDKAKAKQAIGIICATARKLDVQTLEQWRALDYSQAMARYGTAWNGLKQLLKIYGLDLDASFDKASLKTLSNDGSHARVRETVVLAGNTIVRNMDLVMQGGHWYDAERLAAWRLHHDQAVPALSVAPAPAASVSPH